MNANRFKNLILAFAVSTVFSVMPAIAETQSQGQMTDHMMGDKQSEKMMQSQTPGYGMGPKGMMGGMGMMGGKCPMGMMGGMGPFSKLDLKDQQRSKIGKISDALRKKNLNLMGKMMDEMSKLRDLYAVDKRDPKKIGAIYGKFFELKRQMIEATIDARNRQEAVLTKEQREKMRRSRSGMMGH